MTHDLVTDRDLELLADLSRLLKKHGHEAFQSLASLLANPEFVNQLSGILAQTAAMTPRKERDVGARRAPGRAPALELLDRRLSEVGGDLETTLRPIIDTMMSPDSLPRLRDLREYAERNNLPTLRSKSRREGVAELIMNLLSSPPDDIRSMILELESSLAPRERSLEGWNRIIERSRAEVTR